MKLGKKLLSLLTVLCLTLSLFPTMAFAADDGRESAGTPANSVSVGNVTLNRDEYLLNGETSKTQTAPPSGTGYIHFTSDGTLELNGYTDENTTTKHQISGANLTIHLTGNNHINSAGNGIYSAGTLTISGPGSLTLTPSTNGTTIYATNTIKIQGGAQVIAPGGYNGQSIHLEAENKEIIITGSNTVVNAIDSTRSTGIVRCGNKYNGNDNKGIVRVNDGAKLNATTIQGTLLIDGASGQLKNNTAESTAKYTVSGTVKNGDTYVTGASVQLCTTGTANTSTVINTSNDGTYRFTGISNGNYTITVSKDGYTADSTELSKTITVNGQNVTRDFSITPISYYISVNGIAVTGANKDNVLNDATATVKYTPADEEMAQKLTLNGANISASETTKGIESTSGALDIELIGENKIETDSNSINSSGALTITSTKNGSLTMSSKNNMSTLYATADITISGSAIVNATINGGAQAIHSNPSSGTGSITITGNAKVTAKNTRTLGQTSDVTKAHSVALLTGTYDAATPSGAITVSGSASLLAQGSTQALKCGTFTTDGLTTEVSKNYTGVNPETSYNSNSRANYKYVHVHPSADVVKYDVWVGRTQVTSTNKGNVLNDSNTTHAVTYDPATQTLTLTDATITGAPNRQYTSNITDACGIYSKHDLTIKLIGDNNKVQGAAEQPDGSYGIFVEGRLTFIDGRTDTTGSTPSITVSGGKSNNSGNAWVPGVYASGITVKNCNVTAIGGTATSDSYPVAYAMSKAPTLVGAKVVKASTTNSADGVATTYDKSSISRYQYLQIQKTNESDTSVAAPVIAPEGGYFTSDPHVTISCPTDGATIYYTTDGTEPSSTHHANQITLNTTGTTTIKAIAVEGEKKSDVVTATFTNRTGDAVTAVALDVSVDTHKLTLKAGDTQTLSAAVKHEETTIDGLTVTWASDNTDVATVENGKITALAVGKARITAAVVENGVTYSDFCDVIVEARPSSSHHSSSSTTYYDVNAAVSGEGGSVAAGTKRASRGTTVTVTATAASGYQVAQVSAVDKDGKTVSLTDKGDGVYTFVMPASKVDVTARFAQVQKPEEKDPYGDVSKDSYYYDAVKWAAETGVTTGVGDGLFAPEWVCTRGQIVTFLWRASGSPAPKATELPFTDVAADAYYAQAVLWAVENGITNGTSETTFGPDQTCTRAHAVAFLYRMSGSPAAAGSTFSDVAADAYYRAAVAWAVEKGITNGTSGTTFSPDDTCTRGQIVTFLYRLAQTK